MTTPALTSLFDGLPESAPDELFTPLLDTSGVRIERIVSFGHITPEDSPYDQHHDEWVLLLRGSARLWLETTGEQDLSPGDFRFIPAHCRHRVTWTTPGEPTVWLAIHLPRGTSTGRVPLPACPE